MKSIPTLFRNRDHKLAWDFGSYFGGTFSLSGRKGSPLRTLLICLIAASIRAARLPMTGFFQIENPSSASKTVNKTIGLNYICRVIFVEYANLWCTTFPDHVSGGKENAFENFAVFISLVVDQCTEEPVECLFKGIQVRCKGSIYISFLAILRVRIQQQRCSYLLRHTFIGFTGGKQCDYRTDYNCQSLRQSRVGFNPIKDVVIFYHSEH